MRRRAREAALELLGDEPLLVDESANFFGLQSRGRLQIRGNGCLALGEGSLVFVMWLPRRSLVISRASIAAVDQVDRHLGKSVGRPLLRVRFADEHGAADTAAWWVADLPRWRACLAL